MSSTSAPSRHGYALDVTKGILILAIVLGHNILLMKAFPAVRWFLYSWHVFGFFLVAFLVPFRSSQPGFLKTRIVRYTVPYIFFVSAACLAAAATGKWRGDFSLKIFEAARAMIIGSADLLDAACGARLYWFLPCLLGLTILRWAIDQTGSARVWVTGSLAVGGFLFAGLIPHVNANWIPLGLPIVAYILGPCIVFAALIHYVERQGRARLPIYLMLALVVLTTTTALAARRGSEFALASFDFFSVSTPIELVNHALLALSAATSVYLGSVLLPESRLLAWIGRQSLLIYLVHQFIYVPTAGLAQKLLVGPSGNTILAGSIVLTLTVLISIGFAAAIGRLPRLASLITPRDAVDFAAAIRGTKKREFRQ